MNYYVKFLLSALIVLLTGCTLMTDPDSDLELGSGDGEYTLDWAWKRAIEKVETFTSNYYLTSFGVNFLGETGRLLDLKFEVEIDGQRVTLYPVWRFWFVDHAAEREHVVSVFRDGRVEHWLNQYDPRDTEVPVCDNGDIARWLRTTRDVFREYLPGSEQLEFFYCVGVGTEHTPEPAFSITGFNLNFIPQGGAYFWNHPVGWVRIDVATGDVLEHFWE